jgi:hypothetical protein
MLLRASGEKQGREIDAGAVTAGCEQAAASGVTHAAELLAFADACVAEDDAALAQAREALLAAVGPAALVDAAAVVSNFERMVRVADGTGIPLDAPIAALTAEMRRELGIDRFASAANTPAPGWLARALARWARPLLPRLLRLAARPPRRGEGGLS